MGPISPPCTSPEDFLRAFPTGLDGSSSSGVDAEQFRSLLRLHHLVSKHRACQASAASLVEICEALLAQLKVNPATGATVDQLVHLLSQPTLRALFEAHDDVSARRFEPRLPDIPYEVDEDDGIAVKLVRLLKRGEALGATIKCESDGRVLIARVLAGGVADRSASIQVGDQVLEVNGVAVRGMSPGEIVRLLSSDGDCVTLKLVPTELVQVPERAHVHVRAQFSYDPRADALHPCPEAGLTFARGDILELIVCDDEHWWQARNLGVGVSSMGGDGARVGLVPSQLLQQKRLAAERAAQAAKPSPMKIDSERVSRGYESVALLYPRPELIRPILLIGAPGVGRNELKRRLLMLNPERYASTIPHTSRPPRAHETNGIDYHFVSRAAMEEWMRHKLFLEYGEYRGNLYGTLISSVRELITAGLTPLLNPHPLALRLLRNNEFKPLLIFVQPPDFDTLKETRRRSRIESSSGNLRSRVFTDADLSHMIATSAELDRQFGQFWDARIVNANIETAFEQLMAVIQRVQEAPTWVPTAWTVLPSPPSFND